jgi:long-chain acyl-CoA synthetase
MNLALWLNRAGLSHGVRPALAQGARTVRTYAELAERVARLAGGLRTRFGLAPGDRVALVA